MPLLYGWWIPVLFCESRLWTHPPCPTSDELWIVYLLCCNKLSLRSLFSSFNVPIRSFQTKKFMPTRSFSVSAYFCSCPPLSLKLTHYLELNLGSLACCYSYNNDYSTCCFAKILLSIDTITYLLCEVVFNMRPGDKRVEGVILHFHWLVLLFFSFLYMQVCHTRPFMWLKPLDWSLVRTQKMTCAVFSVSQSLCHKAQLLMSL